jgi:hypothetical protein
MNTEAFVHMLARGAGPAPRALALRRLAPAAAIGLLCAVLASLWFLGPIPVPMWAGHAPWMKLLYAGLLAAAAAWWAGRLGRPAARLARPQTALLAVILAMALLGLVSWWLNPPEQRPEALMGHSWNGCSFNILLLALPGLAAALWALRGMAPTKPALAGAAAGLFAGALGAAGYALACTETSPSFVALWYTLGMGWSTALGALLGPRLLRW